MRCEAQYVLRAHHVRDANDSARQHAAIHIADRQRRVDCERRSVLEIANGSAGDDHRRIVHRCYVDRDLADIRAGAIVQRVLERRLSGEVRRWRERHDPVDDGHRAVDRAGHAADRQRLGAGRVRVVCDQRRDREGHRRVLERRARVVGCGRRFRHVGHGDRERAGSDIGDRLTVIHLDRAHDGRIAVGVFGLEVEALAGGQTDLVGARLTVGRSGRGNHDEAAVDGRAVQHLEGEACGAVDVAHGDRGDKRARRVFGNVHPRRECGRGVVDRCESDLARRRDHAAISVDDGVADGHHAVEIGIRHDGVLTTRQRDGRVGRSHVRNRQRVGIDVSPACQEVCRGQRERDILGAGERRARRAGQHRSVIGALDLHCDDLRRSVRGADHEGIDDDLVQLEPLDGIAAVVERVGPVAVRVDRPRAERGRAGSRLRAVLGRTVEIVDDQRPADRDLSRRAVLDRDAARRSGDHCRVVRRRNGDGEITRERVDIGDRAAGNRGGVSYRRRQSERDLAIEIQRRRHRERGQIPPGKRHSGAGDGDRGRIGAIAQHGASRQARQRKRERLGVGIGDSGCDLWQRDRRVFRTAGNAGDRDHRFVRHRRHRDGDRADGTAIQHVGEGLLAGEVFRRLERQAGAAAGDQNRTAGRLRHRRDVLVATVDVGVVGQDVDLDRAAVLVGRCCICHRHRCVVHRLHVEADRVRRLVGVGADEVVGAAEVAIDEQVRPVAAELRQRNVVDCEGRHGIERDADRRASQACRHRSGGEGDRAGRVRDGAVQAQDHRVASLDGQSDCRAVAVARQGHLVKAQRVLGAGRRDSEGLPGSIGHDG